MPTSELVKSSKYYPFLKLPVLLHNNELADLQWNDGGGKPGQATRHTAEHGSWPATSECSDNILGDRLPHLVANSACAVACSQKFCS